jgi:hypothetical protein
MTRAAPIRVGPALGPAAFGEVRRAMELHHFKWDAQVGDATALARFPLIVSRATWDELAGLARGLAAELAEAEREIVGRPELFARIGVPRALARVLREGAPVGASGRVLRFDFHFTTEGWRISEVNSDVPGGFTEATHFTALMAKHTGAGRPPGDPTRALIDTVARAAGQRGVVALLSAPFYVEDQQVVSHLAARLRERGIAAHLCSVTQLRWQGGRAGVDTTRYQGPASAIVRFYQAEWLARLSCRAAWAPLFAGGITPVVNPGAAALTESKRLPLVFADLGASMPTWRRLLPETRAPEDAPFAGDEGWLIKSAYSNTGDTVSFRGAMSRAAWMRRVWTVRLRPGAWVAQRRFEVVPVETPDGPQAPCVGVYTIDGEVAGAYARITARPVIDFAAADVALLVDEGGPERRASGRVGGEP